jgi:hypothetical protein
MKVETERAVERCRASKSFALESATESGIHHLSIK